jgi:hypothetical protein
MGCPTCPSTPDLRQSAEARDQCLDPQVCQDGHVVVSPMTGAGVKVSWVQIPLVPTA